jgi:membrane fusion protein (multidrug efflux system)
MSIKLFGLLAASLAALAGCGAESNSKPAPSAPRVHLVELATAAPGRLSYTADRAGSLRAVREVRIVNQEEGRLTEVRQREGDRVRAGEVLVRYDDRILRAELDKSSATLHQAELDHERSRQLKEKGFVSEDAVSRAATALEIARAQVRLLQVRVQHMTIAAPFDGVVARRLVEPGNVTPQHTHLLTVIDPSQLVTDVNVSELVMPYLALGDRAEVRIDALGEKLHPGRIARIHPAIDAATRTGRVEVVLNPVPPGARAGQFCRVVLSTGASEQLVVPLSALQRDAAGEYVYVYDSGQGNVRRAGVASGLRLADRVEIRDGLERGAQVVVKGFLGLAAGQQVKPVAPRERQG